MGDSNSGYRRKVTFCSKKLSPDKLHEIISGAFRNSPEFHIIGEDPGARVLQASFRKVEPDDAAIVESNTFGRDIAGNGSRVELTLMVKDDNDLTTKLCNAAMVKVTGYLNSTLLSLGADNQTKGRDE